MSKAKEVKEVAAHLLAGMLSNPHIYPTASDEGSRGQREQNLVIMAIELAESLVERADERDA